LFCDNKTALLKPTYPVPAIAIFILVLWFEGIRGYWNDEKNVLYIFKLEEHIDRLLESCKLVSIPTSYTKEEIICAIKETVIANNFKNTDIALRVTVFGDGIGSWHSIENFDMFIAPIKRKRTDINNLRGLKASISSWQRINDNVLPPRAKLGANYINGRYAYLQAKNDGYDVPLFLGNDGKITESSGACVFIVKNSKLITPDVTSSILESITRKFIIEYAKDSGYQVEERKIDRTEVYLADEVFLVGTAAEITPIIKIDKFIIGNGNIGKITKKLLKDYLDIVSGKNENYIKYLTPIKVN